MIADNLGGVNHGGQSTLKAFGLACQAHEELEVFVAKKPEQATLRAQSTYLAAGGPTQVHLAPPCGTARTTPIQARVEAAKGGSLARFVAQRVLSAFAPPLEVYRTTNDIPTGPSVEGTDPARLKSKARYTRASN